MHHKSILLTGPKSFIEQALLCVPKARSGNIRDEGHRKQVEM